MCVFVFFQAEDGIRDLVRSRGLGDVYKRQALFRWGWRRFIRRYLRGVLKKIRVICGIQSAQSAGSLPPHRGCLLYTSDAADERSSVDLGGRRIIKKKNRFKHSSSTQLTEKQQTQKRRKTRI